MYSYQWETNLGPQWLGIPYQTSTSLDIGNLIGTVSVRLAATDAAGCGSVVSDEVNIQVLEAIGASAGRADSGGPRTRTRIRRFRIRRFRAGRARRVLAGGARSPEAPDTLRLRCARVRVAAGELLNL